jgi:hypothetical protein
LVQVRVLLCILHAGGGVNEFGRKGNVVYNRERLAEELGYSMLSGTIGTALHGIPEKRKDGKPARRGRPRKGLIERGMVEFYAFDILEGLREEVILLTGLGREVAERLKAELGDKQLPPKKSAEDSTNLRYRPYIG